MDLKDFKIIPSFPDYLVNEYGVVYSTLSNKILTHRVRNKQGYLFVTMLTETKISKNVAINRLVAHVYLGMNTLYNDLEVDHIDRNIHNNHVSNLQILTKDEHYQKTLIDNGFHSWDDSTCSVCGCEISKRSEYCIKHSPVREIKNPTLTIDDIESSVKLYGWVQAGKIYNLSDNGLRKSYKRLGGNPSLLKKQS